MHSPESPACSGISIGVDTGGTHTDLVLAGGGRLLTLKVPSTTDDLTDGIIEGVVTLGAVEPAGLPGHFETGRLRPLAITSPKRSALMPNVPTIAESGYPSYQLMLWYGMVAPKGTPQAIVDRLSRELKAALAEPDMQSRLKEGGTDPIGSSPKELVSFVDAEVAKWRTLIK